MAWFRKKPDPISDRARALNDEIAQLEAQIRELDGRVQREPPQPEREPAADKPSAAVDSVPAPAPSPQPRASAPEVPIFEEVPVDRLKARNDAPTTPAHYNELGVRKYDLPALFRRIRNHFRGPSTTNPRLVSYLAAGGIQGLRPLRYEKRVARNRFIVLVVVLFVILLGLLAAFVRRS